MGFNNGYDAGWQDCETQNRAKWEKAAAEKALANAPSAPALDLGLLADYDVEKLFSTTDGVTAGYLATLTADQISNLFTILAGAGALLDLISSAQEAMSASNEAL